MLKLLWYSIRCNLSAHLANRANLIAGALGMIVNNGLMLLGLWGMLFAGKEQNQGLLVYYIALQTLVFFSFGILNFFFGGWRELGDLITDGQFESKMATPRHPLYLVGIHSLHPSALGDILMGFLGLVSLIWLGQETLALRMVFGSVFATLSLFAVYVFAGSLSFYFARGNTLSFMVQEMVLSLSSHPVGKMFPSGQSRMILMILPVGAASILPLDWIETAGLLELGYMVLGTSLTLLFSLFFFKSGIKRFQALSSFSVNR
jgi:ABC-type uncharacterized transport system permease subunit